MRCPKIHQIGIAPNATTPSIWRVIQATAEEVLDYVLALKNMSVEEISGKFRGKKVENSKVPLFVRWDVFRCCDWFRGAFFTKITFPEGFLDNSQN